MSDQTTHYSDQTTYVKMGIEWLNHLNDYGIIVDTVASSNLGSLTTYADLRAVIAAVGPPVAHRDTVDIIRQAIGDGTGGSYPGQLGRLSLILGSTLDSLIATASGQAAGSRLSNLTTALALLTAPDTVANDARYSFHMQV